MLTECTHHQEQGVSLVLPALDAELLESFAQFIVPPGPWCNMLDQAIRHPEVNKVALRIVAGFCCQAQTFYTVNLWLA